MNTTLGERWLSFVDNAQAIRSMYSEIPDIIVIHEAILHREGPRLDVRVDLDGFPQTPPRRWNPLFNRVQLRLRFDALSEIDISRWSWGGLIEQVTFARVGASVSFLLRGPAVQVGGLSESIRIVDVSAYQDAESGN